MLSRWKQGVLTTRLGSAALDIRDRLELVKAAWQQQSTLGTASNDLLATKLITRICAPQKTFIDIGAHIGSVIAATRQSVPSAHIVAVEAIPAKVAALRRSFPGVEIHQCALGDQEGVVPFYINTSESGFSSLLADNAAQTGTSVKIEVAMKRLDQIVTRRDVDAIKIDVEGAELMVLKGGTDLIAHSRPIIMFESGPPPGEDVATKGPLWDFFHDVGYLLLVPNRLAHEGPGLTREAFVDSHRFPRQTTNYIAVAAERQSEFRERARRIVGIR